MTSKFTSLQYAKALLTRYISDPKILRHCEATQQKAAKIAHLVSAKIIVDKNLVNLGALLHDIGRAKVHGITHGFVGGQILQSEGYKIRIIRVVERHVLGGFTADEAQLIGLPTRNFVPQSWEEKIVCVADKLGHYEWNEINQTRKWESKMCERFTHLRDIYGSRKPFETSIRRALDFGKTLAKLAH